MNESKRGVVASILLWLAFIGLASALAGCTISRIEDGQLVEDKISVPIVEDVVKPVEEFIDENVGVKAADVAGAIVDAAPKVIETAPEIIEDVNDGDWTGVVIGVGSALAAVVAGIAARKRLRKKKGGVKP